MHPEYVVEEGPLINHTSIGHVALDQSPKYKIEPEN